MFTISPNLQWTFYQSLANIEIKKKYIFNKEGLNEGNGISF